LIRGSNEPAKVPVPDKPTVPPPVASKTANEPKHIDITASVQKPVVPKPALAISALAVNPLNATKKYALKLTGATLLHAIADNSVIEVVEVVS
jgi:hypothetical protein